jgi:hypothetical protein
MIRRSVSSRTQQRLPRPLTSTAPLLLHTQELSWEALEHLVVEIAVQYEHAREARPFGRRGQAQGGIDVVAFFGADSAVVYQAKRYKTFTAADLDRAVDTYATGSRPFGAQRLVVVTTADVQDTQIDLELVRLREQHHGLQIDLWGRQQLSDMLFRLPSLVSRFFGEETMRQFCRPLAMPGAEDPSVAAVTSVEVQEYLGQLTAYLTDDLHELVPLPLREHEGTQVWEANELPAWLRPGSHVQLAGAAGTGKSHLMAHTLVGLAWPGWLPILMRAGLFEGNLKDSIDECVAPFTERSAQALVEGAAQSGQQVVLFVDAINECPAGLQERLLQQLGAWCRRTDATLVSSSHDFVRVPASLSGTRLLLTEPDAQQRAALLRSYGASPEASESFEDHCAAFSTAFELSLAARLLKQLPEPTGRGVLLEAYVRDQLERTSQPTAVRQVLHCWALLMDEHLTGWLPLAQAQRSAAQLLIANGVPAGVVDEALGSPLVRVQGQRVGFRHEWYGQFMAAEALLWQHTKVEDLTLELGRSHRRGLGAWAVPLLHDPEAVRHVLQGLQESDLLVEALRGRLGLVADQVSLAEARRCLEAAREATAACRILYRPEFRYTVQPRRSWSSYELGLFAAIGTTARDGRLLEPLARLLRETDQASRRGAEGTSAHYQESLPSLIASMLIGPVKAADEGRLPVDYLMDAARLAWARRGESGHGPAGTGELRKWIESLDSEEIALRTLLCLLLRGTDDGDTAALAPTLFTGAWATGAHHMQFAALDVLTSIRTIADEATVDHVITLLSDVHTEDVLVSSMLVDALHTYDQLTSPYAVTEISEEITSLLADPDQSDARERASRIVESQFEDVIAAPFNEAIAALEPAERTALMALAARGGNAGLFTQFILRDLIQDKSPVSVPAFQYWASHLDPREPFRQGAVACFVLGIEGCANHFASPPLLLAGHEGSIAEAWRCYGQILFWLYQSELSPDVLHTRCMPLWEQLTGPLLHMAFDPLHQFRYAVQSVVHVHESAIGQLVDAFPAQIRTVLHHTLAFPDHPISFFPYPDSLDRTATALSLLALVGDHSSLSVLTSYRSHASLGSAASDAIRHLNERTVSGN